jgi:hypothetical protein
MSTISIFAKLPFRNQKDGHLMRISTIIRGFQVAEAIGANLNPEKGYENDTCIYVKPHIKPGADFTFHGKPFLDIIDGNLLHVAAKHPNVTIIACSNATFEYVTGDINNKVVLIPQHHCNFERAKRTRREVTTVGVIGSPTAFDTLPPGFTEKLAEMGLDLITFSTIFKREDVIDYFNKIDIQLIWNPAVANIKRLANPLKIVNASSFGIPTVAHEDYVWEEMRGCYIPAVSVDDMLKQIKLLSTTPDLYAEYADRCIATSEKYHIDHISKLYLNLASS